MGANLGRDKIMATNKQIYDKLQSIDKLIPITDKNVVGEMRTTIRSMYYSQIEMKNDIKEIAVACNDRRFGCGNNK